MPGKVIFFSGLPGSGKSTEAKKLRDSMEPGTCIIVERDEIRSVLFGEDYHRRNPDRKAEEQVSAIQNQLIEESLRKGMTVINSDTNLNQRFLSKNVKSALALGAKVEHVSVDVPVEVAKERNRLRGESGGRFVPEEVIDRMAERAYGGDGKMKRIILSDSGSVYFVDEGTESRKLLNDFNRKLEKKYPIEGKSTVLVDVDGTLANNGYLARRYFQNPGKKKDFLSFYRGIAEAPVNGKVRDLANSMRDNDGLNLIVLTGRDDEYSRELIDFIERSGIKASRVIAKGRGDFRADREFKNEVIGKLREDGLVPVHAIDDRESSIETMERNGIMVSRVSTTEGGFDENRDFPDPEPEVKTVYGSGTCIRCGSPLKSGGNIGPTCRTKI